MKTVNNHLKTLCLCNMPAQMNSKKRATALPWQPPEASSDLSFFFEQRIDKTEKFS